MRKGLGPLLRELERRDAEERQQNTPREQRARNIRPEVGQFLNLLVKVTRPRLIVEVGASNGYSTLWLADAAHDVGGHVISFELRPDKQAEAQANLAAAGLADVADVQLGDAHELIGATKGPFNLAFLDAEKDDYVPFADRLLPKLPAGGLLVADNILSHAETQAYLDHLAADPRLLTTVVPLGQGEAVTIKMNQPLPEAFLAVLKAHEERARTHGGQDTTPREMGALLYTLARAGGARRILEIGGGSGIATAWLAQAARANKGSVVSVERDTARVNQARRNLAAAGLTDVVDLQIGESDRLLPRLNGPFDLVFLDADLDDRLDDLDLVEPLVTPGALLLSAGHLTHGADLASYTATVRSLPNLESLLLPVGSGLEMTWVVRKKG